VAGTLTVDTGGMSLESLMFGLRDIGTDDIIGVTVPSEPQWIGNTSYIIPFEASRCAVRGAGERHARWLGGGQPTMGQPPLSSSV
jgi:hypothetical protein